MFKNSYQHLHPLKEKKPNTKVHFRLQMNQAQWTRTWAVGKAWPAVTTSTISAVPPRRHLVLASGEFYWVILISGSGDEVLFTKLTLMNNKVSRLIWSYELVEGSNLVQFLVMVHILVLF